MNINRNSLSYHAIVMFLILVLSKILGLARDMVMAYKFGTSPINDAYNVASAIPNVLFAFFVSGYIQTIIPYSFRLKCEIERKHFYSNLFVALVISSVVVACICGISSDWLTMVLIPDANESTYTITSELVSIMVYMFPFYVGFGVISAYMQTKEEFLIPNFCNFIIINIIIIITIWLADAVRYTILAYGFVISMAVAFSIVFFKIMRSEAFCFPSSIKKAFEDLIIVTPLAIPVGLSYVVNQINTLTDLSFASSLGEGIISSLNYANKIQTIFLSLTTTVFMTVCYPRINAFFSRKDFLQASKYIKNGLHLSMLLSIPFTFFIIYYCKDLVVILFKRGEFGELATQATSLCLYGYAIGIPFYSANEVFTRAFTAKLMQKKLLLYTIISVVINILLDYILIKYYFAIGLSMATTISGCILCVLLYNELNTEIVLIRYEDIIDICKIIVASALSLFISRLVNYNSMVVSVIVFSLIYSLLIFLLKNRTALWVVNRLRQILLRR